MKTTSKSWLSLLRAGRPTSRLFCFPYAGGGASTYRSWRGRLPADVELGLVHLPGREGRISEAPVESWTSLSAALLAAIEPHLDLPYVLMGHSMGALIAFELTRALASAGHPLPRGLVLSGHAEPSRPSPMPQMAGLDDAALVDRLRRLGGTPGELLAHQELLEMVLPTIRADLGLCERYAVPPEATVPCPIDVLGGRDDALVTDADLRAWERRSTAEVRLHSIEGDHFFIHAREVEVVGRVATILDRVKLRAAE